MKFSPLATLFPLLLSSVAYATMGHDVVQARQAHVKRALVDVCAALDLDIKLAPLGINLLAGHINICLCLSLLPGFLDSHPVAQKVIDEVGRDSAHDYFAGLIQNEKGHQQCHYPQHGRPFCSIRHPCGFTCEKGYTAHPTTEPTECICKPPYCECNGVCGYFPHGCGSQGFSKRKDDSPSCPAAKTMCGVPNGAKGYDCVNIKSDVESCGGCTVASPFGNNVADGKNCKNLPNVERSQCDNGTCKVISCKAGYDLSGDKCLKPRLNRVRHSRSVEFPRGEYSNDDVLGMLFDRDMIVGFDDVLTLVAFLGIDLELLDVNSLLKLLVAQGLILDIPGLLLLGEGLGLGLDIL